MESPDKTFALVSHCHTVLNIIIGKQRSFKRTDQRGWFNYESTIWLFRQQELCMGSPER